MAFPARRCAPSNEAEHDDGERCGTEVKSTGRWLNRVDAAGVILYGPPHVWEVVPGTRQCDPRHLWEGIERREGGSTAKGKTRIIHDGGSVTQRSPVRGWSTAVAVPMNRHMPFPASKEI